MGEVMVGIPVGHGGIKGGGHDTDGGGQDEDSFGFDDVKNLIAAGHGGGNTEGGQGSGGHGVKTGGGGGGGGSFFDDIHGGNLGAQSRGKAGVGKIDEIENLSREGETKSDEVEETTIVSLGGSTFDDINGGSEMQVNKLKLVDGKND